jgi:hypothetical protein
VGRGLEAIQPGLIHLAVDPDINEVWLSSTIYAFHKIMEHSRLLKTQGAMISVSLRVNVEDI